MFNFNKYDFMLEYIKTLSTDELKRLNNTLMPKFLLKNVALAETIWDMNQFNMVCAMYELTPIEILKYFDDKEFKFNTKDEYFVFNPILETLVSFSEDDKESLLKYCDIEYISTHIVNFKDDLDNPEIRKILDMFEKITD